MAKEKLVLEEITDKEIETFVTEVKKQMGENYQSTTDMFSLNESAGFYKGMFAGVTRSRSITPIFMKAAREQNNELAMQLISDMDANAIMFAANIGEVYLGKKDKPIFKLMSKGGQA